MQFVIIEKATIEDAEKILEVQKKAFASKAKIYAKYDIPSIYPMRETVDELKNEFRNNTLVYKVVLNGEIIGSIRMRKENSICKISRLSVDPAFQNQGRGTLLLNRAEESFKGFNRFELYVGNISTRNIRFYLKRGYEIFKNEKANEDVEKLYMRKSC